MAGVSSLLPTAEIRLATSRRSQVLPLCRVPGPESWRSVPRLRRSASCGDTLRGFSRQADGILQNAPSRCGAGTKRGPSMTMESHSTWPSTIDDGSRSPTTRKPDRPENNDRVRGFERGTHEARMAPASGRASRQPWCSVEASSGMSHEPP